MKKRINSRSKGAAGEREAARFLTSLGFHCTRMGRNGRTAEDLDCKALSGLHIECKRNEAIDIGTEALVLAYTQACADAPPDRLPIVLWRRNGCRLWRVTWHYHGLLVTSKADGWLLNRLNTPLADAKE